MERPQFVYVTYISASPEKVWEALLDAEITAKYWQHVNLSDWRAGSTWEHRSADKERVPEDGRPGGRERPAAAAGAHVGAPRRSRARGEALKGNV
jgi:uncharacterized protein YndB with AHSA1/START domain